MQSSPPLSEVLSCRDVPDFHDPVEPTFAPELRPGFVLDRRFVLGEPISRSGMATIYKAHDQSQGETVAVKVPHLRFEADPAFFSRFEREQQIGQKLDHPFLLRFISVKGQSRPYIVTEYLQGCSLAHILSATRPLPEKDALKIASLLCEALGYMHSQGVIHRDLKPGNVMICCDGTLRLLDFGIASAAIGRRITITGFNSIMGTPQYMAPEQVRNQKVDERTDIYGLGAVLYEMLTGVVPFEHEDALLAMNRRVTGDPVAPSKLNPNLSAQAEEIVLRALRREPAERYQSAAHFKEDLDSPEKVVVTGLCDRLQKPRFRISMRETPIIAGTLVGLGFLAFQAVAFLVIYHLTKK